MKFYKYSGSGNDFVFLNNFTEDLKLDLPLIKNFCERKLGVGADGVAVVRPSDKFDYSLQIFNSDGSEAEMCGNAARCSIHFAHNILGLEKSKFSFGTMNGEYRGELIGKNEIKVQMTELSEVDEIDISDFGRKNTMYLNTGVPHAVIEVGSVDEVNVESIGAVIRNDPRFKNGTNVDFFEVIDAKNQSIKMRVFERGVEGETLCCGTGVIATAVTCAKHLGWSGEINIETKGGKIKSFVNKDLSELFFQGTVKLVFSGEMSFE